MVLEGSGLGRLCSWFPGVTELCGTCLPCARVRVETLDACIHTTRGAGSRLTPQHPKMTMRYTIGGIFKFGVLGLGFGVI